MPLKILLFSYNYDPEFTGIGKYNTEFCKNLVEIGHNVEVITAFPYYPYWKLFKGYKNIFYQVEEISGVKVIRCPVYIPTEPSGVKRICMDFSFYCSTLLVVVNKLVSSKVFDVVFVPSPSFLMGIHILMLRYFWKKTKFIYHIQDLQIDAALELGLIKQPLLKKGLIKIEQLILEKSSLVSTISEGMKAMVLAKSNKLKEVYLMPNWVDDKVIYPLEVNLALIEELGIPLDKKIFFYSGSIGEKQGLEVLLSIGPKLAQACPDLVFVISGSGPYKAKLQSEVLSKQITNILFIDLQPTYIFNQLLNYVDCHLIIQKKQVGDLLLPSKLTNILAVGGLSITTAESGTSLFEVITKDNLGIIIEPENEVSLLETIRWLYKSLILEKNLGTILEKKNNAKVYADKYLNKNSIIDSFLKHIENC